MSGTDATRKPGLVENVEPLQVTVPPEGEKGQIQVKSAGEMHPQTLPAQGRDLDRRARATAEGDLQRRLHPEPRRVPVGSEGRVGPGPVRPPERASGYGAALIATSIFLPSVAAVFTMVVVLVEWSADHPYLYTLAPVWAALGTLAVWLVFAGFCRKAADAQHAIPSSYGELLPRLVELKTKLKCFGPVLGSAKDLCKNAAYCEAVQEYGEIQRELAARGFVWLLATGYSKVWRRLYHAEEAMIEVAPRKKVLEGAYYDEARLEGSDIPNREDLLAKLRKAVISLDPSAQKYLKSTAGMTLPPALAIGTTALAGGIVATRYCATLLATGGVPPYRWTVIGGALPDALILTTTGVLCGTPTCAGHTHFTLQVTDGAGVAADKCFDLLISPSTPATSSDLAISTTRRLPCGVVNVEYVERLFATGGKPPYQWRELSGGSKDALPQGMNLSKEGVLSGRPVKDDPCEFEVEVADSANPTPNAVTRKFALLVKPTGTAAVPVGGTQPEQLARAALRHVRTAINIYRNDRWNGLILVRNHLLATFTLTTMVIFALLATAVMSGAPREQIIAATVFYLVGATVGLCNRLRSESRAVSAVPDYGLSAVRRITLPLFSGLGALGGLLLLAYLPYASPVFQPLLGTGAITAREAPPGQSARGAGPAKNATPRPSTPGVGTMANTPATPPAPGTDAAQETSRPVPPPVSGTAREVPPKQPAGEASTGTQAPPAPPASGDGSNTKLPATPRPQLKAIFDLDGNLIGILAAMIFGFAPGLLFDHLQQQADRYKADLKSSQPAEATAKS
jgi:hypothetical protein